MKREPGKCLELFLRLGKHCIGVRWRRRRNGRRRGRRRRSICKWRIRSLKSVSLVRESTVGELDNLGDNEGGRGNTLGGLRCCSNLYCKKTEEEDIIMLFKLLDGGLSGELNGEFCDTKLLKSLMEL
jgi:hypothetical protein